ARRARAAIDEPRLRAIRRQLELLGDIVRIGQLQHFLNLVLVGTVEDRGCNRYTVLEVLGQLDDLVVAQPGKIGPRTRHVVHLVQVFADFTYLHKRSEEHTSELQSRENLVCRLLLEKKKQTNRLPEIFDTLNNVTNNNPQ